MSHRSFFLFAALICAQLSAAPKQLRFEKNLEIGSESQGEAYEFGGGAQFAVGDSAIFVLDSQNFRVQVFDHQGKFLRTFGAKGEGPGEFTSPGAILVNPKGEVVVFDVQRRIAWFFSPEGAILREARLPEGTVAVILPATHSKGGFVASTIRLDEAFQQVLFHSIFNDQMEVVKNLSFTKMPANDWSKAKEPSFWVRFLATQFDQAMHMNFASTTDSGYVLSEPGKYDFKLFDNKGEEKAKLSFPFKPQIMSEDSRRKICEQIYESMRSSPFLGPNLNTRVFEDALAASKASPMQNPVQALFGTEKGFGTLVEYRNESHTGRIELFDAKGKLLGSGEFKGAASPFVYAKGQLYQLLRDEDDVMRLRRYAIKGL